MGKWLVEAHEEEGANFLQMESRALAIKWEETVLGRLSMRTP